MGTSVGTVCAESSRTPRRAPPAVARPSPDSESSEALLRRPHADALVSDPRPILHRGGLINPPHGSADTLAACGPVRSAGDFPLAGLVGEAVSGLEVQREDVVGEKSDLPSVLLEGRCLPHDLPERVERGFGLSFQPIHSAPN